MPVPLRSHLAVIALALGATLSGCAPMLAQQCANKDWYAAGLEDGLAGRPLEHSGRRAEDCRDGRVGADAARYEAGRAAGLLEYCTIEGGVRAGRSGRTYRDVCADEGEDAFLTGYYLGALSPAQ